MNKFFWIIIIVISLMIGLATASQNCWQEGCSDLNLPGGSGYTGYASNQNNIVPNGNISYSSCDIGPSTFALVAGDFNGDNASEIVAVTASAVSLYSQDCILTADISTTARATPIIMNSNGNAFQELVIMTNHTVNLYEFSGVSMSLIQSFDFWAVTNQSEYDYMSCSRNPADNLTGTTPFCILMKKNVKDVISINMANGNISRYITQLPNYNVNYPLLQGFPQVKTTAGTPGIYQVPDCTILGATSNMLYCILLNESGSYNALTTGNILSSSGAVTNIYYASSFIAKMGTLNRIFVMLKYKKTNDEWVSRVYDTSFAQLYSSNAGSTNATSNWMVGDFNKDGVSEACHVLNDSTQGNSVMFECYDTNFLNKKANFNVTELMNISQGFVMGDFEPSSPYLAVASVEGIFAYNGSTLDLVQSSGYPMSSARNGSSILINSPASGSPIMAYVDHSIGFILRNPVVGGSCGNGICDLFESAFSCPIDCGTVSGANGTCMADSECPVSYPKCLAGKCVDGFNASETCNYATDCPYNLPLCYAHYCVAAVSGPFNETGAPTGGVNNDEVINDTLGVLFGASTMLKFIIGICIILAIMLEIAHLVPGSPIAVVLGAVFGLILTTILGLIPVYILILCVLIMVLILLLGKAIFPASG